MNRGINKETLDASEQKGKSTRANPIRVDVLVSSEIETRITEISEALKVEKAAIVRMLLWFGLRFAPQSAIATIANEQNFSYGSQSVNRLDTRITEEMRDMVAKLMEHEKMSKSGIIKTLLFWALTNIGSYTIEDMLSKE